MVHTDFGIESQQGNMSFKGDVGLKQGLRKRSLQGSVPMHEPSTSNPYPHGACTHAIRIIEGDATAMGNVNQFTCNHTVTPKSAGWLGCHKGQHHDRCASTLLDPISMLCSTARENLPANIRT